MMQNLTCFKCHNDTATLTYEENRIYKVRCSCGCEYEFEHSSMKCAEEYHYKMIELYREIDHAKQLQQENEQLKELLRLAVADMKTCVDDTGCEICGNKTCEGFDDCKYNFAWQHAGSLKELGIEI